jgi:hypothetical protein
MVSPSVAKLVEGWCEMATAKPKVKRMMLGGAALGAVKKAVTSKAAPMQPKGALGDLMRSSKPTLGATAGSKLGPSGGSGFNRTPAQQQAISKALGAGTPPRPTQSMQQAAARSAAAPAPAAKQMQFMSDKLRGAPMPPQVISAPTQQMAAAANKKMQATAPKQFMSDKLRGMGSAAMGAARGISRGDLKMAGLMKKGGAVKKATKK